MPAIRADTRTRIQDVALGLFEESGYHATAISDIASALGITKAAIYYHFPSKESLLTAVVKDALEALDTVMTRTSATGPAARRQILESYVDVLFEHRRIILFLDRDASASRQTFLRDRHESLTGGILDLLAPNQENKRARLIAAAALGAVTRPLMLLPPADVEGARKHVLALGLSLLDSPPRAGRDTSVTR